MAQPQPERRGTRRFNFHLPIKVQHPEKGEMAVQTRDVSSRGISFYADWPMAVDSEIEFTLTLPPEVTMTEAINVRCTGRVLRVEPNTKGTAVAAMIERYEFMGGTNDAKK